MNPTDNEIQTKQEAGIEGLINFRDLGISTKDNEQQYIKDGLIFRSGTLDSLKQEQVEQFIEIHKIKTILDLRTSLEGKKNLPIDKSFPTMALENIHTIDLITDIHLKDYKSNGPEIDHGRKKYRVNFAGRSFERNVVWTMCGFWLKMRIIFWMSIGKKARASHLVGTEILTPMGLPTMYKQFLKACKDEILDALRVFTDTNNYPIHVHCTQGKDRTGMVCMLLQGIAGAPDEVVIKDYARTQEGLAPVLPMMVKEMAKSGLSAEFATARPEVMLRKIGEGRESRSFAMPSFAQLLYTSISVYA
ncbi:protein-tyrosine phosphatase-like protein [Umbelopsis sp. PMI_123]|nr:protein-tyrosine phosphatase-like protein [Umbelopsis sp. PMI_123]